MERAENYKIKALVVEDEEKILNYICNKIITLDDSFEIVERAYNGQEAMGKIERLRPQVVFTDISMPVLNGMELIKRIRQVNPNIVIVIISGYSDFEYARQAIRYGVFNYLLKPLEDGPLLETLFDIKKSLAHFAVRKQRHILYSENYQLVADVQESFLVMSVCLGNVIYNTQDEEVTAFYREKLKMISWNKIMQELCGEQEWFVADEHAVNQKIIAVKVPEKIADFSAVFVENFFLALQKETEMAVHICCQKEKTEQAELWNYAKRLRNMMKKSLVIGKSKIFYLEDEVNSRNDMIEIVKMKLNTYIKNYFISTNIENFMNEITMIFKYMKSNHAPQESIEKICIYVLKLLEFSNQGYEREKLEELQNLMLKDISMSLSEEEMFETLLQIFATVNNSGEEVPEEDEVERLLEYIDERYLTIESMEEIAGEFGYNYAYLSRMFKKKVGKSMGRYITDKKMELAKELLLNQTELKVTEVSNLCGYGDYRYFSRVFKSEVGVSPSDYKENYKVPEKNI